MLTFKVHSIPLKDVIISLAESFNVPYHNQCGEYYLQIPEHIGEGEIRGINFENGLGLVIYRATFKEDIRLEYILDKIHPLKFINSLRGPLSHEFANDGTKHLIEEFRCAIVASEKTNGHVIEFEKDILHEVVSIEIDRKTFSEKEACELNTWKSELKKVLIDIEGNKQFYHVDNCGIYFKDVLQNLDEPKEILIAHKLKLQCLAMELFIKQIVQFDDDNLKNDNKTVLRIQELRRVEDTANFIKENFATELSVKHLSRQTGLNPNKLQAGFKYLFSSTVNEFVTNVRLEQANVLLKNKEYNVQSVVAAIGLESSSYFSKIYKKKYGITPKNYKKLYS